MKLSAIKGEEALDVLADIIDPVTEIMNDKEIARIYQTNQPRIKLVKFIIKKHKKEVIEILARLECEEPEAYMQKMNVLSLPIKLLEIMNDKELMEFFQSQGQTQETTTFGSVTESTEENEQ